MNRRLSLLRPSVVTLTVLCTALMGMTSCFLFGGGSKDKENVLPRGDVTTFEVASTLREAGRQDEAILVYFEAIRADSASLVAANAMNEIGGIYIELERYEQALAMYERLLTQFPTYEKAQEIQRKIEFVHKAQQVREERLRVAKEGPRMNPAPN